VVAQKSFAPPSIPSADIVAQQVRGLLEAWPETVVSVVMKHIRARHRHFKIRCEWCRTDIPHATSQQRYCGDGCRQRAKRARSIELRAMVNRGRIAAAERTATRRASLGSPARTGKAPHRRGIASR
jgi:hypothetical protein